MRSVTLILSMLAMVLVVAVPALGQAVETFVSGNNVNNAGSVTTGGDSSNTCAVQQGFNNSGGLLNEQQVQQYNSTIGTGNVFLGSSFNNEPTQNVPCAVTVQQAASASSK